MKRLSSTICTVYPDGRICHTYCIKNLEVYKSVHIRRTKIGIAGVSKCCDIYGLHCVSRKGVVGCCLNKFEMYLQPKTKELKKSNQISVYSFFTKNIVDGEETIHQPLEFSLEQQFTSKFRELYPINEEFLCELLGSSVDPTGQIVVSQVSIPFQEIPKTMIKSIVMQLLEILEFCHERKIYRSILNLENIRLDGEKVSIIDWGLYYMTSNGRAVEFYIGNIDLYPISGRIMSHEQHVREDLYALGIVTMKLNSIVEDLSAGAQDEFLNDCKDLELRDFLTSCFNLKSETASEYYDDIDALYNHPYLAGQAKRLSRWCKTPFVPPIDSKFKSLESFRLSSREFFYLWNCVGDPRLEVNIRLYRFLI